MEGESMKAAIYLGNRAIEVNDVSLPEVGADSALLRVKACAVCGSDRRIFSSGNSRVIPPRILGHEVAGEIVEVGSAVTNLKIGDRLSLGADVPCGECEKCLMGKPNHCRTNLAVGYQFDGGFAEYMLLDPRLVKFGPWEKFDKGLSFEEASLAEPIACCLNGFEQSRMEPGKSVVILGMGPIGLLLATLAAKLGASKTILFDPDEMKVKQARNLGFDFAFVSGWDIERKLSMENSGELADIVFTACPSLEAQRSAFSLVANQGVINFFGGLSPGTAELMIPSNEIHYRELCVTGSHGSTPAQHKRAVQMLSMKEISVKGFITEYVRLDELSGALENPRPSNLKTMVIPHD